MVDLLSADLRVISLRLNEKGGSVKLVEIESSKRDAIELNLAVAEAHFHSKASNEVERALGLFTDDIVWESPARGLIFRGKAAVGNNYRRLFSAFNVEGFRCLQRFATEDRVVDESLLTATLITDDVDNAPAPVGSKVEIRLLHLFEMRDGKIAKEIVFENWKVLQPAINHFRNTRVSSVSPQWS